MIKLLAAADIHMGRRSTHTPDDIAPSRHAWQSLVQTAIDGKYDLLLLTGDLVDWDNHFFEAIGPLQQGLQQLDAKGIRVCLIAGNHDFQVLAQIMQNIRFENIYFLGAGGNWETQVLTCKDIQVAVSGWSFPSRHYAHDPLIHLPRERPIADIHIGMVHGDLDLNNSLYAPLSGQRLAGSGHHLWLLGHVHKPAAHVFGSTPVFYPGSLQALSPKESGLHGAIHFEIDPNGTLREHRWMPMSAVRYEELTVDATEAQADGDFLNLTYAGLNGHVALIQEDHTVLKHLVIDLNVEVDRQYHKDFQKKLEEMNLEEDLNMAELQVRIRDRRCQGRIALNNLEDIRTEPSPAGRLAALILALENDETDEQIEKVLRAVQQSLNGIVPAIANPASEERKRLGMPMEDALRGIVARQARKLLISLLETKK